MKITHVLTKPVNGVYQASVAITEQELINHITETGVHIESYLTYSMMGLSTTPINHPTAIEYLQENTESVIKSFILSNSL